MWKCIAEMCLGHHVEEDVVKDFLRFIRKHYFDGTTVERFAKIWEKIEDGVVEKHTRKGNYWTDNLDCFGEVEEFYCKAVEQEATDIVTIYYDGYTDMITIAG